MNNNEQNISIEELKRIRHRARCKAWREANKEKKREMDRKYREANKEKIKEKYAEYYKKNKEVHNQKTKEYRKLNSDKIKEWKIKNKDKKREYQKEYYKKRKQEDSLFAMQISLRLLVVNTFKRIGQNKPVDTLTQLGCTWLEAKTHFESLFQEGMTWENHGTYGWHIDHIRPVSSFPIEELHLANHISNLQPLWAADNLKKGNKFNP